MKRRLLTICYLLTALLLWLVSSSAPAALGGIRTELAKLNSPTGPLGEPPPWSPDIQVNDDNLWRNWIPDIAVDVSDVYVIWDEQRNYGPTAIYSARSNTPGASWGDSTVVNDNPAIDRAFYPAVAVYGPGNVYAVWTSHWQIHYDKLAPDLVDWGGDVEVSTNCPGDYNTDPDIAIDNVGNIFVIWHQHFNYGDVYFAKSTDAGATWSDCVQINIDPGLGLCVHPAIAVDAAGNALAVWACGKGDPPQYDVYSAKLPTGSLTWTSITRVNDIPGSADTGAYPDVAVDSTGNAYAVWTDRRSGGSEIYSAKLPAGSPDWTSHTRVQDLPAEPMALLCGPRVAVDDMGNAYAVWADARAGSDIYAAKLVAGSSDWGTNVRVNDREAWALCPALAVDSGGNVYAVWRDNFSYDIYFSYWPVGRPALQLPFNPSDQAGPCHNSQNGLNCISAYFDHRYPLYAAEDPSNADTVVVYWGDVLTSTTERCRPCQIAGEGKVCYSGHPAYDFYLPRGTPVLAAADGYATHAWDSCAGNIVTIDHASGYATEYLHLLTDEHLLTTPMTITAGTRVGSVGRPPSKDCGTGYHLHFGLLHNDVAVDAFGWTGNYEDPWPLNGGLQSICLWNSSCPTTGLCSPEAGGTVSTSDGKILVSAPAGACSDTTLLQLTLTPDPVAEPSGIPAWRSFALSGRDADGNPVTSHPEPLAIEVRYSEADITHLLEDTLRLYSWDGSTSAWLPISTTLDLDNNTATAVVDHLSQFTLLGQPLNPAASIASVHPDSGYRHLDTIITISGNAFLPTPSVRIGPNELAVTFVDSNTLAALVPSHLDPGPHDLTLTNPDGQQALLESAFVVHEPLALYLPVSLKNY